MTPHFNPYAYDVAEIIGHSVETLVRNHNRSYGATVELNTGKCFRGQTGYVVGGYALPCLEVEGDKLTGSDVAQWLVDVGEFVLPCSNPLLGSWFDIGTGQTYVDICQLWRNGVLAKREAGILGQREIWDVANRRSVTY